MRKLAKKATARPTKPKVKRPGSRPTKRTKEEAGYDVEGDGPKFEGRRLSAGDWASTVSRTRRAEAINRPKADEYEANDYRLIQTSSHAGVDPDDVCSVLQGQVWALGPVTAPPSPVTGLDFLEPKRNI